MISSLASAPPPKVDSVLLPRLFRRLAPCSNRLWALAPGYGQRQYEVKDNVSYGHRR